MMYAIFLTSFSLNAESSSQFGRVTDEEKDRIAAQLGTRAHEITAVLQNVESAVILLLKTNDLLRFSLLIPCF